jgi:tetratricopeptide (TPR) repeat protein
LTLATLTDRWGAPVRARDEKAVAYLDDAVEQLVRLGGNPPAAAAAALEAEPELALARAFQAYMHLYATTKADVAAARELLAGAAGVEPGTREALHIAAARSWAAGDLNIAARALEDALLLDPRDLLALKIAQDLYFFTGNQLDLRDVAARVLPAYADQPMAAGWVTGMYAFGVEENGALDRAEALAARALASDPADVWSTHAMAHVYEMGGRPAEGAAFLLASAPEWQGSYFAVHNWWHHALYQLELGDVPEAERVYNGVIRGSRSLEWLDLVDGCALLWRLALYGADVAARAEILAGEVAGKLDGPVYVFNDWHAVMALGLAGRDSDCEEIIAATRSGAVGTNREAADRAGLALLEGFTAFAAGAYDRAIDMMIDVRAAAHVVGGSLAQRDVIDLTLLVAAARAGRDDLVRALGAERATRRPSAPVAVATLLAANRNAR